MPSNAPIDIGIIPPWDYKDQDIEYFFEWVPIYDEYENESLYVLCEGHFESDTILVIDEYDRSICPEFIKDYIQDHVKDTYGRTFIILI